MVHHSKAFELKNNETLERRDPAAICGMDRKDVVFRPFDGSEPATWSQGGGIREALAPLAPTMALFALTLFDRALTALNPFHRVPAPLLGVVLVVVVGVYLRHRREATWEQVARFFEPAQYFLTHRYLALFYSPALVLLPVALPLEKLTMQLVTRVLFIVVIGCLLTAVTTAFLVKSIRRVSHNGHKVPDSVEQDDVRFSARFIVVWLMIGCVGSALAWWSWRFVTLSQLALSVGVYCLSVRIPRPANLLLNPMVVIAVAMNAQAFLLGRVHENMTYRAAIDVYSRTVRPVFFSQLGPIIFCFAISVVQRWDLIVAHRLELTLGCFASAAFTVVSTAFLSIPLIDDPLVTRSLLSRGMTVALALENNKLLQGSEAITAAAVALTAALGSIMIRPLLTVMGATDVIVRGVTAAATAHGMGAAVLGQTEPDALPYAGLAYVICGVSGVVFTMMTQSLLLEWTSR